MEPLVEKLSTAKSGVILRSSNASNVGTQEKNTQHILIENKDKYSVLKMLVFFVLCATSKNKECTLREW